MVDTWTPLFLEDAASEEGEEGAVAIHLADGKILQITNGITPVFEWDDLLVINNTDGTVFASASLFTEVCVISNNGLAEGAYYGRMARVGADGFLYLYTENEAYDAQTISKINLTTMQEVATFVSAHPEMTLDDYPYMEVFQAGGVQYFALIWEDYSDTIYIEVVNGATMTSVDFETYTNATGRMQITVGGLADANTRTFYVNELVDDYDANWLLKKFTFNTSTGLSVVSTVATYASTDFRLGWVSGIAVQYMIYDPVDDTLIITTDNHSGEGGTEAMLCKISSTAESITWRIIIDDWQFGGDSFYPLPLAVLGANKRLYFPLNDGEGRHYFVNTETGYWKEHIAISSHLGFAWYAPSPTFNFDTSIFLYFDNHSDAIDPGDPAWFSGFAAYVPEWETPTQPPTGLGFDNDINIRIVQFTTPAVPTTEGGAAAVAIPGTCGDKQSPLVIVSGHRNLAPDTETAHARIGFMCGMSGSLVSAGNAGYSTIQGASFRSDSGLASTYTLRTGTNNLGGTHYAVSSAVYLDAVMANQGTQSGGGINGGIDLRYVRASEQFDGFAVGFYNNDEDVIDFEDLSYFLSGIILHPTTDYTFNTNRSDFLIIIGSQDPAHFPPGGDTVDHRFMFGITAKDGTQFIYGQSESHNHASGRPSAAVRNDCSVLEASRTGAGTTYTGTVTWATDTSLTFAGSVGSPEEEASFAQGVASYIAYQMPANTSYKTFTFLTPTEEGEVAVTGLGFKPYWLLMFGCSLESMNSSAFNEANAGGWQISTVTKYDAETTGEIKQYSTGFRIKAGADPTDTASSFSEHALAIPSDSNCYEVVADLVSMDEDGFTLDYTSVAAAGKVVFGIAVEIGNINTCESAPAEAPDPEPGEALIGGSGMQMDALGCVLTAQIHALETRDLNSILELGPFRFVEQKESDETSMITTLVLGLSEADTGIVVTIDMATEADTTIDMDTLVDVLGDDIYIDMGEGVGNSDDFTLELLGNDDGSTYPGPPIEFKPEELTPIEDRGSTKQYSPTGYSYIYHRVRLKATEIDEKFAVKFVDISGQLTGRLF